MSQTKAMESPAQRLALLETQIIRSKRRGREDEEPLLLLSESREHIRLHRGTYLSKAIWNTLSGEDRHLSRVLSVKGAAKSPPVFSHVSAAVLLGLPIYSSVDRRVHVTNPLVGTGNKTDGVVRHRMNLTSNDIVSVRGLLCTSPERTIIDLARSSTPELAIGVTDGYLRESFKDRRRVDWHRLADWKGEMSDRLNLLRGSHGLRQAKRVLALADPRTESVLESVSHLQLRRLGFELDLQVAVPSPSGGNYYLDFEFLGLDLFGECDGKIKYLDEQMRGGLSADEIVYRDKRRQDWVFGSQRKQTVRWGYVDVSAASKLAHRLRAFGVQIPSPAQG